MPVQIPSWLIKNTPAAEVDALLEWRLGTVDVCDLLDAQEQAVLRWARVGRRGVFLRSRLFGKSRAYRLVDVEEFAELCRMPISYESLHPALRRVLVPADRYDTPEFDKIANTAKLDPTERSTP